MSMHQLRYSRIIADGDSWVCKNILKANPYGDALKVKKISCKNHILRCFRSTLDKYQYYKSSSDRVKKLVDAKIKIASIMMRLSNAIDSACRYRASHAAPNAVQALKQDILNAPNHVFGDHRECAAYFCDGNNKENEVNLVPVLQEAGAFEKLVELIKRFANESPS